MTISYRDAGVDLAAAGEVTAGIKRHLQGALFGSFLPVPQLTTYDLPVLVSSIDGIGTKVRLAGLLDRVETLGQDIVHHCVNDIAVHGAVPLQFLDYLAMHRLDPPLVERIVAGIADACAALGLQLAGGETAEMPLVYPPGQFDVAGAVIGVVEQAAIVDGSNIRSGDVLIGLPSSGLHTNGYSLVQRVFGDDEYGRYEPDLGTTLGEALLAPHRCYVGEIQGLLGRPRRPSGAPPAQATASGVAGSGSSNRSPRCHTRASGVPWDAAGLDTPGGGRRARPRMAARATREDGGTGLVHGMAHITGGGIEGNLSRILPDGLRAFVDLPEPPPLFDLIERRGVSSVEMRRVFNMGIGLIAVCDGDILTRLPDGFRAIGEIESGERGVFFS